VKACLNQDTLRTSSIETFLPIAKETGYEAIELTMDKVEPIQNRHGISELRRQIDHEGLKVASINGPENFNLLNETEFEEILKRTLLLASSASELGCDLLLPVPSMDGKTDRVTVIQKTAEALRRLADACPPRINLGFEFLGMRNCSVNNLADAVEIVNMTDRSNVGLTLDSFHLYLSGTDFADIAKLDRKRIFMVHVNDCEPGPIAWMTDSNRLLPGQGVIDLSGFASNLREVGYDGFVSLELLRPEYWTQDPVGIAKTGRDSLDRYFDLRRR
jgi:2-keto-myo-inositol isomerase